ncbi:ABC transporter substrate-binding protein [Variovorax sp. LjRoot130]|uniref:ABC transporter substrate-binding protein n=1 Tax=Variovorax sp. LjRoot130 TaxID=3342261 RepID=UPI003ED13703
MKQIIALAVLASTALLSGGAMAQEKVRFQTDWLASGEHAAYYGALVKGIWAEEGLDVTITRGYGSGDTAAKVGAGAADFGVSDMGAVLTARARANMPVKTIAAVYTYSPHSLFVLKSSGIKDFKGLEGKKIGITPGNSHKLYFPKVAAKSGTDASKIVWVNMDGGAMGPQLFARNIDAAPFYSIHHYYQNKAARKAGGEIVVLPFVKSGFAIYSASLITSDKMLQERPETVRKFLRAARRSFEWARDNQVEACKMHVQRVPEVDLDDCLNSLKATLEFVFNDYQKQHGFGQVMPERLKETWHVVAESQDLDPKWNPAQAVDTRFLSAK